MNDTLSNTQNYNKYMERDDLSDYFSDEDSYQRHRRPSTNHSSSHGRSRSRGRTRSSHSRRRKSSHSDHYRSRSRTGRSHRSSSNDSDASSVPSVPDLPNDIYEKKGKGSSYSKKDKERDRDRDRDRGKDRDRDRERRDREKDKDRRDRKDRERDRDRERERDRDRDRDRGRDRDRDREKDRKKYSPTHEDYQRKRSPERYTRSSSRDESKSSSDSHFYGTGDRKYSSTSRYRRDKEGSASDTFYSEDTDFTGYPSKFYEDTFHGLNDELLESNKYKNNGKDDPNALPPRIVTDKKKKLDKTDSFVSFPTLNSTKSDISPYVVNNRYDDKSYSSSSTDAHSLKSFGNKSSLGSSFQNPILEYNSRSLPRSPNHHGSYDYGTLNKSEYSSGTLHSQSSNESYLRTSRSQSNLRKPIFDFTSDPFDPIRKDSDFGSPKLSPMALHLMTSGTSTQGTPYINMNYGYPSPKQMTNSPQLPAQYYKNSPVMNRSGVKVPPGTPPPAPPPSYLPPQPPTPKFRRTKSNSSLNSSQGSPYLSSKFQPPLPPPMPSSKFGHNRSPSGSNNSSYPRSPSIRNNMPSRKKSNASLNMERKLDNSSSNNNNHYIVPSNDIKDLEWLMDDLMINMESFTNPDKNLLSSSSLQQPNYNNIIQFDPQTFFCRNCSKTLSAQHVTPEKLCMICHEQVQAICAFCSNPIEGKEIAKGSNIFCIKDYIGLFVPKCKKCGLPIKGETVSALGGKYHKGCFTCVSCDKKFTGKSFYVYDGQPVCRYHFHKMNNTICKNCNEPIEGQCIDVVEGRYHPECFKCCECHELLNMIYYSLQGNIYCEKDTMRMHKEKFRNTKKRTTMKSYIDKPKYYN